MNESTKLRSRCPLFTLLGMLALPAVAGCGGLAVSPDTSDPISSNPIGSEEPSSDPEASDPVPSEVTSEPSEDLPPLFDILDLQEVFLEALVEGDGAYGCDFKSRVKVNLVTGRYTNAVCVAGPGGSHYGSLSSSINETLTPTQRTAIQDAYRQVRSSNVDKCTSGAGLLTLAVETGRARERRELLFADDDHAGCPAPSVPSTSFVSGLPELYALLASLL